MLLIHGKSDLKYAKTNRLINIILITSTGKTNDSKRV